ncbi:MAG: carbohydrate ABC transporter permease [Bacillota bacterium]|nr:carbohydrate ABC transporter permease [Bacillota bacterium]
MSTVDLNSTTVETTRSTKSRYRPHQSGLNVISRPWDFAFMLLIGIFSLFILIPMALVVIVSFSSELSITKVGFSFTPTEWTLDGYKYLFRVGDQLLNSYLVTIFHSIVGTLMAMAVMTLYSYVLAQRRFRFRLFYTWILFFTMLFGGGLVPTYILNTRYLGIGDSIWIFLLPGLVSAYNVIILRTFINSTIPDTLFEAARIDGAGHWRIFFSVVLPLFKAGIATIGLFQIVGRWNNWFTGMLYIQKPHLIPLQTMLMKIQQTIDFLKQNSELANTPDGLRLLRELPNQNLRMATTVIVILPIIFAYPFFQRYFVTGLTVGSVKG